MRPGERGLLYVAGVPRRWLAPGVYRQWFPCTGDRVALIQLQSLVADYCQELDTIILEGAAQRVLIPSEFGGGTDRWRIDPSITETREILRVDGGAFCHLAAWVQ